jgi:protein gp37
MNGEGGMGKTIIEWTDLVWNPVTGCTKISAGCKNCYAERMFHRPYPGRAFTDVRVHPERLEYPPHWRKPRRVFVNSMSDLFHEAVPFEFILAVLAHAVFADWHTYQILTKRPERMLEFAEWMYTKAPCRVELMRRCLQFIVSVEDQPTADQRIPLLLQFPCTVRGVSYEPALGPLVFNGPAGAGKIDWVIAGGESGPRARPAHPDWFRSVRDQCQAAGVPFFFKQWGEWLPADGPPSELIPPVIRMRACLAGNGESGQVGLWYRLGKARSGRLLDGREWNEFPK